MGQPPSLALAFAALERPQVVQRLIRSVRKYFPSMPIYVADQSLRVEAMASFYAAHDVTLLRMPYDVGVTASRNRLAAEIVEDYFILCDDDFIFGPDTAFANAVSILEMDSNIGVMGGRLYDFYDVEETVRNWELYLQYDRANQLLFSIPIYELAPQVRDFAGARYYLCDAVMNFAVFRRSIFKAGAAWDEQFKSNGEHEDFYLNLKVNTPFKVAYLPTMVAYHHHPEFYRVYRSRLRERNEGWRLFFEKWGLEQHVEFGLGVRTVDDFGRVTPPETARKQFFVNPNLSLRVENERPSLMMIGDFVELSATGALNAKGERAQENPAPARLLINPLSRTIIPVPEPALARPKRGKDDLEETYQLEAPRRSQPVSATDRHLYFRYDPILRDDSDFFLWYLCAPPKRSRQDEPQRLSTVARWSAADGTSLIWRTRRSYLDLQPTSFWRPIFLEVPLPPSNCRWLRFDLVTDGGDGADPVCTGFLFRPREAGTASAAAREPDVLALGRLPYDGATPGGEGAALADIAAKCKPWKVTIEESRHAHDMSIMHLDSARDLDAIYFVGWEGLGRSLVSARLPSPNLPVPPIVALPSDGWSVPGNLVYGVSADFGLVQITR